MWLIATLQTRRVRSRKKAQHLHEEAQQRERTCVAGRQSRKRDNSHAPTSPSLTYFHAAARSLAPSPPSLLSGRCIALPAGVRVSTVNGVVDVDDRRVVLGVLVRLVSVLVNPSHQERAEPRDEQPADHRHRDLPTRVRPLVGGAAFGVFKPSLRRIFFVRQRGGGTGGPRKRTSRGARRVWDGSFKRTFSTDRADSEGRRKDRSVERLGSIEPNTARSHFRFKLSIVQ